MLTYPKNYEGSITIIGEKGTVRVGGVAVNEIQHWEFADAAEGDDAVGESSYATDSVYGIGHPLYYENVFKAIRGEAAAETDGREGLRSLELLIGCPSISTIRSPKITSPVCGSRLRGRVGRIPAFSAPPPL